MKKKESEHRNYRLLVRINKLWGIFQGPVIHTDTHTHAQIGWLLRHHIYLLCFCFCTVSLQSSPTSVHGFIFHIMKY